MDKNNFNVFDNACIAGDLEVVMKDLRAGTLTPLQLNTALRHAVAYTRPDTETREDLIDALIDHGATVDWADRGVETITNAVKSGNSSYILSRVLNASDGNESRLTVAAQSLKSNAAKAIEVIEKRKLGPLHIGL